MPLEIFKPGKHTAMSGHTLDFTEDVVASIASSYDPALAQAPLVAGHPKHDDPAYGWVKSLAFASGILTAEPEQVDPAFAEMVNKGTFKKISASLYPPDHPSNPKPGSWYLRHVGFLGAMPPAVKGLKTASFSEVDGIETLEFGDDGDLRSWEVGGIADTFRTMREWFIGKFGLDEANKAIPSYAIDTLTSAAARIAAAPPDDAPGYHEPVSSTPATPEAPAAGAASQPAPAAGAGTTTEETVPGKPGAPADPAKAAEFVERENSLTAKEAEIQERENALKAKEREIARAGLASFCEDLKKEGRLTPAMTPGLVDFMSGLDQAPVLEFGEGDDKKQTPSLDFFKSFLSGLPKLVEFGSVVDGHKAPDGEASGVEFAAAPGFSVTTEGLEELGQARAYAESHNCSLMEAIAALAAGEK